MVIQSSSMVIQSSKSGNVKEDDCLAIFKPANGFSRMWRRMVPFSAAINGE